MRVSSMPPCCRAAASLPSSARSRRSRFFSCVSAQGARNRQPTAAAICCHSAVLPSSSTSSGASAARAAEAASSRLTAQPRANPARQLFDLFRLPDAGNREHVPVISFEFPFELLRRLNQRIHVLQVLGVVRLQDLLLLRLAVGQLTLRKRGLVDLGVCPGAEQQRHATSPQETSHAWSCNSHDSQLSRQEGDKMLGNVPERSHAFN